VCQPSSGLTHGYCLEKDNTTILQYGTVFFKFNCRLIICFLACKSLNWVSLPYKFSNTIIAMTNYIYLNKKGRTSVTEATEDSAWIEIKVGTR